MLNFEPDCIFSFVMSDPGGQTLGKTPSMSNYISMAIHTLSQLAGLPAGGSACLRRDVGNWVCFRRPIFWRDVAYIYLSMVSHSERILLQWCLGTEIRRQYLTLIILEAQRTFPSSSCNWVRLAAMTQWLKWAYPWFMMPWCNALLTSNIRPH